MFFKTSTISSTIHSEALSCGITLTHWHIDALFHCALSTSVSLIIFSASSSVSFTLTFFSRGAGSVQSRGLSSKFALRRDGQLFFCKTASSLSVGHFLVNATVVRLCEVVHHGGQLSVHVRVSLLTFTRSGLERFLLPGDETLFVGLIVGCPVVLRLDDRHVPVGGRRLVWSSPLRYHVCRKTSVLSCFRDASWRVTSPFGAVFGPPTASRRNGPSVP